MAGVNRDAVTDFVQRNRDKRRKAQTLLFDRWYARVHNLKLVQRLSMAFVTTLKSNRL